MEAQRAVHVFTDGSPTERPNDFGDDPATASQQVAEMIGLSTELTKVLAEELNLTDEDPILAVRVNDAWTAIHSQATADAILDDIATYNMVPPNRRDAAAGHRWIFHFKKSSDIDDCRDQVLANSPNAFALSPAAVALGAVGLPAIPMAFCAVIHKIGVREDDVQRYDFFYV
ncbi:hypothetical protein R1flu_023713 [Riccia fluitans]|uniref:Uncharacterized protein n=1 Tax=Riccia fluitans TaxID=41844 RepID=A0ABD1XSV2_9MARC